MKSNERYKKTTSNSNHALHQKKTKSLYAKHEIFQTLTTTFNKNAQFSTMSKNLAVLTYNILKYSSHLKSKITIDKFRRFGIFRLPSSQESENKNRDKQKKAFKCDDEEELEKRKKEENQKGCCYEVSPELKWAEDNCSFCTKSCPIDVPLKRLKRRFKDKDVYKECLEEITCERLDDGKFQVVPKLLPKLDSINSCEPCFPKPPSISPKMLTPKKSYDDSKMKYPHVCIHVKSICVPRLDDICPIRYKRLQTLKPFNDCKPCVAPPPTISPPLKRMKFETKDPPKLFDRPCPCPWKPDHKKYKKLRKIKFGKCNMCKEYPTKSPKFYRLKKKFKTSSFKWKQVCVDPELCPPRLDKGLIILPKTLQKIKIGIIPKVPAAPKSPLELKRPHKSYDDKIDEEWNCPDPLVCVDPRLDDTLCNKKKKLKKYKAAKCDSCTRPMPTISVPLRKLKRRFKDKDIIQACDLPPEPCFRLDGEIVIEQSVLPDMPPALIPCEKCFPAQNPKLPKLKRLRRRVPILDRVHCDFIPQTCNIEPPRLDDICCVMPKAKNLPPFNPKMYPQPKSTDIDYCWREPFDIGKVCCFAKHRKSKSIFLPKKKIPKPEEVPCACKSADGFVDKTKPE